MKLTYTVYVDIIKPRGENAPKTKIKGGII